MTDAKSTATRPFVMFVNQAGQLYLVHAEVSCREKRREGALKFVELLAMCDVPKIVLIGPSRLRGFP